MTGFAFFCMFGLMFMGVPVAFSILNSGIAFLVITDMKPLTLVCQRLINGLDSFPLLAVPLFILVGNLMDSGGISRRLIKWTESLVGSLPGGMGIVTIISCAIFAALTGSGPATVAAIGSIMIPSLINKGYKKITAAGMVAAAGALGPVIPPSIPMIIYGVTMNLSVPAMFIAGILPGLFIVALLLAVNFFISVKNPKILSHSGEIQFSLREFLANTWSALGALLLPFIILYGIYGGIFTPTEAAAVGVAYALLVGIVFYREIKIKDLPKILINTVETAAMVNFIIATANLLSWVVSVTRASNTIINGLMPMIYGPLSYLLVLNLFLLFVGALLDTVAAIIIIAPILVPIGIQLGIDPLHLGVLFVINLVIGYVTPPFGYNLFTACTLTGLKLDEIVKGALPFILAEIVAIFILAYIPSIIMWLPRVLNFVQ